MHSLVLFGWMVNHKLPERSSFRISLRGLLVLGWLGINQVFWPSRGFCFPLDYIFFLNISIGGFFNCLFLSRCQFHQHFMRSFFVQKSFEQLFCTYGLGLYFFGERKLAQKLLVKCWWNWPKDTTLPLIFQNMKVQSELSLFRFHWCLFCLPLRRWGEMSKSNIRM